MVASVGYDPELRQLEVEFISGSIYIYESCLPVVYENLMNAPSIGRYMNKFIVNVLPETKIG